MNDRSDSPISKIISVDKSLEILQNISSLSEEIMILDTLKDIIFDQLGVARDKVTLDSSIFDDLGADSLDVVEMLMELESRYNVVIDDEVAPTLKTVGDVVKYIEANVG